MLVLGTAAADARADVDRVAPDELGERLAACAACHGERGEGVSAAQYIPHLAGKPAGYLFDQLEAFRDGRRRFGPMEWLLRVADDSYLDDMATYYARQQPVTLAQQSDDGLSPERSARARALVEHGDPGAGIPACTACHGRDLAGLEPGVPALVGLPADYIVAQLGAWRAGARSARAPDCMADIARRLDGAEMRSLAMWLAARGDDEARRPAPAGSFDLPLRCGELPATAAAP